MGQSKQAAIVIAGFPGVGKTHFAPATGKPTSINGLTYIDLDTTPFSHINGSPNPDFPNNYISHIKTLLSTPKTVLLIGVHDVVRDRLVGEGIQFTLVYPEHGLKAEYMERWTRRGSPIGLIRKLDQMWDNFTASCAGQKGCRHVVLREGEFLENVMPGILNGSVGVQK